MQVVQSCKSRGLLAAAGLRSAAAITSDMRMKILRHTQPGFLKDLDALKRHSEPTEEVRKTVAAIIADIRKR